MNEKATAEEPGIGLARSEAVWSVRGILERTGLPVDDFFHRSIFRTSNKSHRLRRDLFWTTGGVTREGLERFDACIKGWVANASVNVRQLREAANELTTIGRSCHLANLGDLSRALSIESALNQIFFEGSGKSRITLYRGLRGIRTEEATVALNRHPLESHSTSPLSASAFGRLVVKEVVPSYRVAMSHKTNTSFFPYEHEFVLFNPGTPQAALRQKPHKIKERLASWFFRAKIFTVS